MSTPGTEGMGFAINLGGASIQAIYFHFSYWRWVLKSFYSVPFSRLSRSVLKTGILGAFCMVNICKGFIINAYRRNWWDFSPLLLVSPPSRLSAQQVLNL